MKRELYCKIFNDSFTVNNGVMLNVSKMSDHAILNWIYDNCQGFEEFKIEKNPIFKVTVIFENRIEIYYIKEK